MAGRNGKHARVCQNRWDAAVLTKVDIEVLSRNAVMRACLCRKHALMLWMSRQTQFEGCSDSYDVMHLDLDAHYKRKTRLGRVE